MIELIDFDKKVKEWFLRRLNETTKASYELKESIKNAMTRKDNYVDIFLKTLSFELKLVQQYCQRSGKTTFKVNTLASFVADMTDFFCWQLEEQNKRMVESESAKLARKYAEDKLKDLDSTIEGNPKGDYTDAIKEGGVTISETKIYTS